MTVSFGLGIPAAVSPGVDAVAEARLAEAVGFDFVSTNDHVHGQEPRSECWTLLTWIAAETNSIRVATRVLGVPYRNPGLLAKMAETLSRLSGGRLILGLGAGSAPDEFRALGLDSSGLRDRMTGLEEAIQIIHAGWHESGATVEGRVHRIDGLHLTPQLRLPVPIWLGTTGPRGLGLVGKLADGWIPSMSDAPPERVPSMLERIREAASAAGRDPALIASIYNIDVRLNSHLEPGAIAGEAAQIAERLNVLMDLGFTGFNFVLGLEDRRKVIESLGRHVLEVLRR